MRVCSVAGCERIHDGLGYCRLHRERYRNHGDPLGGRRPLGMVEPVVCVCPTSTPEHIWLFDAWQCTTCWRKCHAPSAVAS